MNKIIDGQALANEIIERIKREKRRLKLGVVLVGDNPVSRLYLSQKEKICRRVGFKFCLFQYPQKIREDILLTKIKTVARQCSGLIIQLPLPSHLDTTRILNAVPVKKDIDVLTSVAQGKFYSGDFSILPPVVSAIKYLLEKEKLLLKGKNIVVIGSGRLVGKPLTVWLMAQKATVLVINRLTVNLPSLIRKADILISGVGKANLVKGDMIKRGAVVIDVGSSVERGSLTGDLEIKSVIKKASRMAVVPGGVGPITTACLLENLIKLYQLKQMTNNKRQATKN